MHRPMNLALPIIPTGAYGMRPYAVMNNSCFVGADSISARSNVWQYKTARANMVPPPASLVATCTHQKAGANISFAPAVLLLRSHSLITLARYFSDCTLVFMGDHPNFCDFVEPFQDLSYLFIGLTLWFVICLKAFVERGKIGFKIGPGVLGLMLRTAPLNSCTLECLLVDQMKFRFFLFGGVVTVIATDLLSS